MCELCMGGGDIAPVHTLKRLLDKIEVIQYNKQRLHEYDKLIIDIKRIAML